MVLYPIEARDRIAARFSFLEISILRERAIVPLIDFDRGISTEGKQLEKKDPIQLGGEKRKCKIELVSWLFGWLVD